MLAGVRRMSDETPGATQGALPPREGQQGSRAVAERPAVRLTQVAGAVGAQYVITTSQPHGVPALAQVSGTFLLGAKIIDRFAGMIIGKRWCGIRERGEKQLAVTEFVHSSKNNRTEE